MCLGPLVAARPRHASEESLPRVEHLPPLSESERQHVPVRRKYISGEKDLSHRATQPRVREHMPKMIAPITSDHEGLVTTSRQFDFGHAHSDTYPIPICNGGKKKPSARIERLDIHLCNTSGAKRFAWFRREVRAARPRSCSID